MGIRYPAQGGVDLEAATVRVQSGNISKYLTQGTAYTCNRREARPNRE